MAGQTTSSTHSIVDQYFDFIMVNIESDTKNQMTEEC